MVGFSPKQQWIALFDHVLSNKNRKSRIEMEYNQMLTMGFAPQVVLTVTKKADVGLAEFVMGCIHSIFIEITWSAFLD